MENKLCQQAEDAIEERVPPAQHTNYMKIVGAGMKVALDKNSNLMGKLAESQDPVHELVPGVVGILGVLRRQSQGTMPIGAMIPAGMTLVLQGLNYLEKTGHIQVTNEIVNQATHDYTDTVMARLKVTPDKVQQMIGKTTGLLQDPGKLAQLQSIGKAKQDEPA